MKKSIFTIGRCYTLLVTLFWATCCIPYICVNVTQGCDKLLGLPIAVIYPFVGIAVIIGFLNLLYFRKELPLADRIFSVLIPPALALEMLHIIEYCYAAEIGFDIIIGIICFIFGIAVEIYFVVNTVKYYKKKEK